MIPRHFRTCFPARGPVPGPIRVLPRPPTPEPDTYCPEDTPAAQSHESPLQTAPLTESSKLLTRSADLPPQMDRLLESVARMPRPLLCKEHDILISVQRTEHPALPLAKNPVPIEPARFCRLRILNQFRAPDYMAPVASAVAAVGGLAFALPGLPTIFRNYLDGLAAKIYARRFYIAVCVLVCSLLLVTPFRVDLF